jgi:hypothetical protein
MSNSSGHSSGANSSQDGLSNMRMIVRRIFEWGPPAIAIVILVVAIKFYVPWGNIFGSFAHAGITVSTAITSQCDYAHRKLELGSEPVAFNPGARCAYNFTVAEGAIEFGGPDGSVVVEANTPVQQHLWIETARAVNGHAVLLYQLYPPAS